MDECICYRIVWTCPGHCNCRFYQQYPQYRPSYDQWIVHGSARSSMVFSFRLALHLEFSPTVWWWFLGRKQWNKWRRSLSLRTLVVVQHVSYRSKGLTQMRRHHEDLKKKNFNLSLCWLKNRIIQAKESPRKREMRNYFPSVMCFEGGALNALASIKSSTFRSKRFYFLI